MKLCWPKFLAAVLGAALVLGAAGRGQAQKKGQDPCCPPPLDLSQPPVPTVVVKVCIDQEIETKKLPLNVPQRITATPTMDSFSKLRLPIGSYFIGQLKLVAPAESRRRPALLEVFFDQLVTGQGRNQRVIVLSRRATPVPLGESDKRWITAEKSLRKRPGLLYDHRSNLERNTVLMVGGGALGGAAGGVAAGTVLGASLGAGIGAGAGLVIALLARGREAVIPAGQVIGISVPARLRGPANSNRTNSQNIRQVSNPNVVSGGTGRYPKAVAAQAGYNGGDLHVTATVHVPLNSEQLYLGDESYSRGTLTLHVRGPQASASRGVIERLKTPVFVWNDPARRVKRIVINSPGGQVVTTPFEGSAPAGGGNPTGGAGGGTDPTGGGNPGGGGTNPNARLDPLGREISQSLTSLTRDYQNWLSASAFGKLGNSKLILSDLQDLNTVARIFQNPVTAEQRRVTAGRLCYRGAILDGKLSVLSTVPGFFKGQWAGLKDKIEELSVQTTGHSC